MHKKGQAAMEFLMTYGWALLVVLAAIAALAYFGVLSPDSYLPEKCTLPSGIPCLDFTAPSTSEVNLVIQNSAGFDISSVTASVDELGSCTVNSTTGNDNNLTNGEKATLYCSGSDVGSGKFKSVINLNYTNEDTGLDHNKEGELIIKMP